MTVLSGFAYGLWVIVIAFFCGMILLPSWPSQKVSFGFSFSRTVIACAALAAFYLLPPGSLPPFVNISWGGVLLYVCLAFAVLLSRQDYVIPCLALLVVCAAFSWYAWHQGMPGSPLNMGTFIAVSVWELASLSEICAFLILGAGCIMTVRGFLPNRNQSDFVGILFYLAMSAFFVTVFLPWHIAPFVTWPDPVVAGVDFLFFWAKILIFCFLNARFSSQGCRVHCGFVLSVVGAVFLVFFSR